MPLDQCRKCPFAASGQPVPLPSPKVGDVFAEKLKPLIRANAMPEGGCSCDSIQTQMNALGWEGCLRKADYFAGEVVKNLNASAHWQKHLPDKIKRLYFRLLIKSSAKYVRDWKPPKPLETQQNPADTLAVGS